MSETAACPATSDLKVCQLSSWYSLFTKETIRSIVVENLPAQAFLEYMAADTLVLPKRARTSCALLEHCRTEPSWEEDDHSDGGLLSTTNDLEDNSECDNSDDALTPLTTSINTAIATLGGAVIPKVNWSAPKDSIWTNAGTMECRFAGDVYLLLKASDFVASDILLLEQTAIQPQLVLRKWCNLHPSQEFRCFVRNRELVAISQRHDSQHWPHLADLQYQEKIEDLIWSFFESSILQQTEFQISHYAFDVYIDRKDRVWLLDFNVWGARTDPLLFTWSDLETRTDCEMRVVTTGKQVRSDPLASYKAPTDVVDLAADSDQFREFMAQCKKPGAHGHDEDGDSE